MTDQLRKKLQEEVDALEHELVHELPKEIKRAAALGDLSENAEYHMVRQGALPPARQAPRRPVVD
jgi:transcription elongation factor GreA